MQGLTIAIGKRHDRRLDSFMGSWSSLFANEKTRRSMPIHTDSYLDLLWRPAARLSDLAFGLALAVRRPMWPR